MVNAVRSPSKNASVPPPPIDRVLRPVNTMLYCTYPTVSLGALPIVSPLGGAYGALYFPTPKHAPPEKQRQEIRSGVYLVGCHYNAKCIPVTGSVFRKCSSSSITASAQSMQSCVVSVLSDPYARR